MIFFPDREAAVQYVDDLLRNLKPDCRLITIISPEKSGGFSVTIATEELSVGTTLTWVRDYLKRHTNT